MCTCACACTCTCVCMPEHVCVSAFEDVLSAMGHKEEMCMHCWLPCDLLSDLQAGQEVGWAGPKIDGFVAQAKQGSFGGVVGCCWAASVLFPAAPPAALNNPSLPFPLPFLPPPCFLSDCQSQLPRPGYRWRWWTIVPGPVLVCFVVREPD